MRLSLSIFLISMLATIPSHAQDAAPEPLDAMGMNNLRIEALLHKLEVPVLGSDGRWQLDIAGREVLIITDEAANRMRMITPVSAADELPTSELVRLMQANFDSALDARYAIAKDILWSAFIHPLRALDDESFILGLGQVVNLANTFGSAYSSGLLVFGGGDSQGLRERELIDSLIKKGLAI